MMKLNMEEIEKKLTGVRFQQFRIKLDKSHREMAEILDVEPSTIIKIESGKTPLTEELIHCLYRKYGINITWLKQGYGTMFETEYIIPCNNASYIREEGQQKPTDN